MSGKTHQLQIGDVVCTVIHDGFMVATEYQNSFPNATADEMNSALKHHACGGEQPIFHMNALFIESDGTRILADTGMGTGVDPHFGHIPAALQSEGIDTSDIDITFISHFHDDHINGLLDENGKPVYPNSSVVTSQAEWTHWMGEETLDAVGEEHAATLRRTIAPLRDRFRLLNAGDTLAPGITLFDAAGHTPGHSGLLIESNGERLLVVMDLLHSLPQFTYPHWQFVFDTDGQLAALKRKQLLTHIADENLLTLFYHLPFPGLGHVIRNADSTFTYLPIERGDFNTA